MLEKMRETPHVFIGKVINSYKKNLLKRKLSHLSLEVLDKSKRKER